jgi:Zn-dependent M28 family amino/carboxypeptidase
MAAAIARLPQRPKRSIVFTAYFGEELGLFGSRYYAAHPPFPLAQTIGNINLEHMGRTDDVEGKQEGVLNMTGVGYSTLSDTLAQAATAVGLKVRKQDRNSDMFFDRSDNQSLADAGIPAHTVLAGYIFPDYHRPGDEWQKLDYANMERLDRAVALGVYRVANSSTEPHWNAGEAKAAKYLKAWQALHDPH